MFFHKKKKVVSPKYEIVESIFGNFLYHIALDGEPLCGKARIETMPTSIPLSAWGVRGHLKERYCKECERIYRSRMS
jgi:hypothetical protein